MQADILCQGITGSFVRRFTLPVPLQYLIFGGDHERIKWERPIFCELGVAQTQAQPQYDDNTDFVCRKFFNSPAPSCRIFNGVVFYYPFAFLDSCTGMPVGFGFGVGDFIATIGLFRGIAVALKDHGGARDDHAKTLSTLETASSILSCLENHYSATGDIATSNAIRGLAHMIRRDVDDFLASIEKYKVRLCKPRGTRDFLNSTVAKIQWSQFVAERVTKLHQEVRIHMSSLHLLLNLNNM